MANENRPASKKDAPDPAHSYERTDPKRESGMGRLDVDKPEKVDQPDKMEQAVSHRQDTKNHVNAVQPDHSMKDEEGLDESPTEAMDPRMKRHPRKEGKGGTE